MLKLDIYYYDRYFFRHRSQHISAIITEIESGRSFNINYPYQRKRQIYAQGENPLMKSPLDVYPQSKDITEGNYCQVESITLMSDKRFDEFIEQYYAQFINTEFDMMKKNCAHAVDFSLDYFFPDRLDEIETYNLYRLVCCPLFTISNILCLSLTAFPSPPLFGLSTPSDVYKKAELIAASQIKNSTATNKPNESSEKESLLRPSK